MIELFKGMIRFIAAVFFLIITSIILGILSVLALLDRAISLGSSVITTLKEVFKIDHSNQ